MLLKTNPVQTQENKSQQGVNFDENMLPLEKGDFQSGETWRTFFILKGFGQIYKIYLYHD